jgi:glycosyltransferase involved in cell wall biosynthesis
MATPHLSIALVTRNRPDWLRQCLQSWRAQDVQPFEIIVSDDSDDAALSLAQKLAKEFNANWIAGPKRGLYANRNHAFRAAKGSHIMSADDDHTHPQGFVRQIIRAIESDPNAVWTVSERSPDRPAAALEPPGELRPNGTIGPPQNSDSSAAIACGSSVYPRKVFDSGLYYDETYSFGGVWYLWGHQLRKAGFRIRFCPDTFVWHHTESSLSRRDDVRCLNNQLECNLFVQFNHALRVSHSPIALIRAFRNALRLWWSGGTVLGHRGNVRLGFNQIIRAFRRGWKNPFGTIRETP